jgi:hypothetical protein
MFIEQFEVTITGGFKKRFNQYPTHDEIEKFIREYYPNGIGYHAYGGYGGKLFEPKHSLPHLIYDIEAKIDKILVYKQNYYKGE